MVGEVPLKEKSYLNRRAGKNGYWLLVIELFRGEGQGARGLFYFPLSTLHLPLTLNSKLYTLNFKEADSKL